LFVPLEALASLATHTSVPSAETEPGWYKYVELVMPWMTLKAACPVVVTFGFVMPATVKLAAVFAASAHDPASVTVTCSPDDVAVAPEHVPVNPLPRVTVGFAGMLTESGKLTLKEPPELKAPVGEALKETVHVDVAFALVDPGV
jgi:hypothetical protein